MGEAKVSEPILVAEKVTKRFGGFVALDGVDLSVGAGERIGLIGPNGSGKSTFASCIAGTTRGGGTIRFDGHDLGAMPPHRRIRLGIARTFQIPRPFASMTVLDNLRVEGLCAGYGGIRVLHDLSLHVGDGETVALLGTNGNGKSTVMQCILGLVPAAAGRIVATLDGVEHDLAGKAPHQVVQLGIALVPEGRHLFPRLTVDENLLLGAHRPEARRKIAENLQLCFETFPALAKRRRQLAGSMSGGEQQMLALARALMTAPKILLVDEPSVGLAPLLVSQVIAKIGELKRRIGLTVLMAEQNLAQAIRIADRGYVIVHGRIEFEGGSREELEKNDLVKRLYLGL
jgi:branched-chain amino acid transport system ATP-binding protein